MLENGVSRKETAENGVSRQGTAENDVSRQETAFYARKWHFMLENGVLRY